MHIEPRLQQLAKEQPEVTVGVVIVLDGACSADVRGGIERAGLVITSTNMAEAGILVGNIRAADLSSLQGAPGIQSVELDSEQTICG